VLSQQMCFAPPRVFVFHVAHVQRPRRGSPASTSRSPHAAAAILNTGSSTAPIQFVEEPVIFRRKPTGHCVPRGTGRDTNHYSRGAIIPMRFRAPTATPAEHKTHQPLSPCTTAPAAWRCGRRRASSLPSTDTSFASQSLRNLSNCHSIIGPGR
jgi:hypothetical protein